MSICEISQNFYNFGPKYIPPLFGFSHCFSPFAQLFPLLLPEFRGKAIMGKSGKSNGKFGQKRWENLGKSNEKIRKAAAYISGKNYCFSPNFSLFFPPEFPIAFARISHCFCPNFSFSILLGGTVPPAPPPPPTPMRLAIKHTLSVKRNLSLLQGDTLRSTLSEFIIFGHK